MLLPDPQETARAAAAAPNKKRKEAEAAIADAVSRALHMLGSLKQIMALLAGWNVLHCSLLSLLACLFACLLVCLLPQDNSACKSEMPVLLSIHSVWLPRQRRSSALTIYALHALVASW